MTINYSLTNSSCWDHISLCTDDAELELTNVSDYSSTCVALCLKNAIIAMKPMTKDSELDSMTIFDDLLPKSKDFILGLRHSKKPLPISKLNEKVSIISSIHRCENALSGELNYIFSLYVSV